MRHVEVRTQDADTVKKNTQKSMTLAIMGIADHGPDRTRIPGGIDIARSGLSALITLSELTPSPIRTWH